MADRNSQLVRAFASREVLGPQRAAAGTRALAATLAPGQAAAQRPAGRWRRAWRRSVCAPSATCSSTCPSDSREARTVAALRRGRAGDGRRAGARDRRAAREPAGHAPARRGHACSTPPARCVRPSSTSRGWSSAIRRGPGCCCTARPTDAAAFGVAHHARRAVGAEEPPAGAPEGGAVAHYPATEGVSSTADPHARAGCQGCPARRRRGAAGAPRGPASGCPTARARWPRCTSRAPPAIARAPAAGSPSRSC